MKTRRLTVIWLFMAVIALAGCGQEEGAKIGVTAPPPNEAQSAKNTAPPAPAAAGKDAAAAGGKDSRPVTVILPLPDLVAADTIEIKGKTRPGGKIFINGREAALSPAGDFAFPFSLQVGKNEIKVVTLGKEKIEDTRIFNIERRPPPPRLTVISPERSDSESLVISGQTEKGCVVYVNSTVARPDREGGFTSTVQLKEGENSIKVTSTNRDGGTAVVEKKVAFNPADPRLQVIVPEETRSKQVTISGITDTDTVLVLYVNDVKTDINLQNGIFSGTITLAEGVNSVTVAAVNKWGKKSSVSRNILYSAQ